MPARTRIIDDVLLRAIAAAVVLASATLFAQNGPAGTPDALAAEPQVEFPVWLAELLAEARTRGFSDDLLNQTLSGLEPLHRVIQADRNQAELNPGFTRYLGSRLTPAMIL